MQNIEKEIKVNNGIITYRKIFDYEDLISIRYTIFDRNTQDTSRRICFTKWNYFDFRASVLNESMAQRETRKKIEVLITIDNPLYIPLKTFLAGEDRIVLDDDNTIENDKKTMEMINSNNGMRIIFNNNKEYKKGRPEIYKFNVVKNNKDPKLINLFKDFEKALEPKEKENNKDEDLER